MSKAEYPVTQAVRFLRSKKSILSLMFTRMKNTVVQRVFAECTGKPEHQVIKQSFCRMSIKKAWLF